jgi:hypothetical protein
MIKTDEPVLKTDELGRVRTPTARQESLTQEFERSGLSSAKVAALIGICVMAPKAAATPFPYPTSLP